MMSSAGWAPDRLLSSDDWEVLDREPYLHYELSDEVLVMTQGRPPAPVGDQAGGRRTGGSAAVRPRSADRRGGTDLPRARRDASRGGRHGGSQAGARVESPRVDPAEVLLAVEVVSPGSVSTERILKVRDYAAVGIPD